jgi:hypothetical protein
MKDIAQKRDIYVVRPPLCVCGGFFLFLRSSLWFHTLSQSIVSLFIAIVLLIVETSCYVYFIAVAIDISLFSPTKQMMASGEYIQLNFVQPPDDL